VYGESPNHSQVNFADPDLAEHPLYALAQRRMLSATLKASLDFPTSNARPVVAKYKVMDAVA
jgi:hypothetical protein